MTTYLDLQTNGAHLFSIPGSGENAWFAKIREMIEQIKQVIAHEQAKSELRAMPDHLLRDIGIERYMLNA